MPDQDCTNDALAEPTLFCLAKHVTAALARASGNLNFREISSGPCILNNISNTTREFELVRNPEPGAGRRERRNGQPAEPAIDDDRLLDHHIEEVLDTLRERAEIEQGIAITRCVRETGSPLDDCMSA